MHSASRTFVSIQRLLSLLKKFVSSLIFSLFHLSSRIFFLTYLTLTAYRCTAGRHYFNSMLHLQLGKHGNRLPECISGHVGCLNLFYNSCEGLGNYDRRKHTNLKNLFIFSFSNQCNRAIVMECDAAELIST